MNLLERRARVRGYREASRVRYESLAAEDAPRERAVRRIRSALVAGQPVLLHHVRWPALRWLIEGLSADLAIEPEPLVLRHTHVGGLIHGAEGWRILPGMVGDALGVDVEEEHAVSAASRVGFRRRMRQVLRHAGRVSDVRRVVFLSGADALGFEVIQDLCFAWRDASQRTAGVPLLVLARRIGGASLQMEGSVTVPLPDPSRSEAVRMVAELLGGEDRDRLEMIVESVGTIPGFLLRVAREGGVTNARGVVQALGSMWRELVHAVELARGQEIFAERLDALCRGPQPVEPKLDRPLRRAGLVSMDDRRGQARVRLRSPLVALACGSEGAADTSQAVTAAVRMRIQL